MKTALQLILICCSLYNVNAQPIYSIPQDVEKIVFLGNSITFSGQYITYIEAYMTIHHPDKQLQFINVGLPSETVSGLSEPNHAGGRFPRPDLHERLDRVLKQTKPDLVFVCYGMNDGIYLPFDDDRFQKFRDGIEWTHEEVLKSGASIIHVTPPVFDDLDGTGHAGVYYSNVLDIYSDWLISCRFTKNWEVIDIHWPMRKELEAGKLIDSSYVLASDGIHPEKFGHWLMAKEILLALGENRSMLTDVLTAISAHKNGDAILKLVDERQQLMKKSWVSSIGHKRPGMQEGLPLDEALQKAETIEQQIRKLLE